MLAPTTDSGTRITSPTPGSELTDMVTKVEWIADPEATKFYLLIGSTPGGAEHHGQWIHNGNATSAALVLPLDGAPIYVSLKTYLPGGAWYQRTVEYATAIAPTDENGTRVISPTPGSTLTQSSTTFRWIGDAESTSYHIRLGSSHRGHDLVAATLGVQATEYTVDLPIDGDPIYFSIATFLPGGAYYYRDYVYQTSNTPRATGVHFYINDHLGTPQQLVSIDQAITWAADYDAFGAATVTTELVSNNHRFPGQYFDAESGLHYNWHRYYDPETGRYTRSDPIGLVGGLNTFGYVGGNPLYWIDPTGRSKMVFPVPSGAGSSRPTGRGEYTGGNSGGIGTGPRPIRLPDGYRDPIGNLPPADPRDFLCTFSVNCRYKRMCRYLCDAETMCLNELEYVDRYCGIIMPRNCMYVGWYWRN